jgi:hypothetical protein
LHPFLEVSVHGGRDPARVSLLVQGDRLASLSALQKLIPHGFSLAYADIPRIEGFDDSRAFQADPARLHSIWLSVTREHLAAILPLLSRRGVLVAQVGDKEEPYVRLILQELFGHQNHLGSIIWQTHYSPKGGRATEEINPIHETLICYATNREELGRVALPVEAEGFANPDGDPRGRWKAPQKDAGRDTVRLTYNIPPYRWALVDGRLPPGVWRISPMSGVIWGSQLTEDGQYEFTVKVEDSEGNSSTANFVIAVTSDGQGTSVMPTDAWWRASPPEESAKAPSISRAKLPTGAVGQEYRAVLIASGGKPLRGTPRPGRGWGFGEGTLVGAILQDRCYFGQEGTAIPQPKTYLRDFREGMRLVNVSSWWSGEDVGWTQDATKHLKGLKEAGLIQDVNPTAKPEMLLSRLLDIFSAKGDFVLDVFSRSADFSATALKRERRFFGLIGASDTESLSDKCP